jgi:RND family efflux transporter MFP subunit
MDEACDQDAMLVYPPPNGWALRVLRDHEALARRDELAVVCSVPLGAEGSVEGAVTFEWRRTAPDAATFRMCEDVVSLLGPMLLLRRDADASLVERIRRVLQRRVAELLGPGHAALKLAIGTFVAVTLLLAIVPGDFRVTADATLEGRVQRAIVAGIEGFVAQVDVRPGDLVEQGQLLARLDDRDLLVERRKWQAQREQLRSEHREALADHDRAKVGILAARAGQAQAQLDLVEAQLARTRLIAPFDGVVVRGDLSQSLGAPVEKGDVLFEIAPLDGYRIVLEVDERDIGHVEPGQRGELALSALPGEPRPLRVERVTPVSSAEGSHNVFRVEAALEQGGDGLRPGMAGVAKVRVGRRRLLWIWGHELLDWLRLLLWSWWP